MSKSIKELKALQALLKEEKKEDFEQFKILIQSLSLTERREKGLSWYPVEVLKTGYSIGDRAFVMVERKKDLERKHQFRSGNIVNLFTELPNSHQPERSGVIQYIDRNKMKIILNSKDIPDWINKGSIGVDLMFDERTYILMEKALDKVIKAKGDRLAELRDILLGEQLPSFKEHTVPLMLPQLNTSQNFAVNNILLARDVAIVHGPPGTGKTTTLVQAIKHVSKHEKTVLVCAPSNTAVDLLTERLSEQNLNVVRVGNISRVNETLVNLTLDGKMSLHPEMKNIKKVKKEAAEAWRRTNKYKRKYTYQDKIARRQSYNEAKELDNWADQLEKRLVMHILETADVITCTLTGSMSRYVDNMKFETLFIDEAAQALEPAAWIPMSRVRRVIFAGDPLQLPPTVKSIEAKRKGFNITLMEKTLERTDATFLLNTQYRMHESIMGFSNEAFYNNELKAHETVCSHTLGFENEDFNKPLELIDTAGCGFDEKINPEYKSRYNPDEYNILREHLYQIVQQAKENETSPTIGIISPYREQVIYIKDAIREDSTLADSDIIVNTIDGFQGQERDVIYISMVRSNEKSEIGFLSDARRMNVAMTRARKKLVIVGDSATLGAHTFYQKFLDYVDKVGGYRTAWEFMS